MEEDRAAHIKELTEARDRVARQIDVLADCRPYYGMNRKRQIGSLIEKLRETLAELEECMAAESDSLVERPANRPTNRQQAG